MAVIYDTVIENCGTASEVLVNGNGEWCIKI